MLTGIQEWDIRDEEQIAECVRHSDIVYNLVGRDYPTKHVFFSPPSHNAVLTPRRNFTLDDVHVKGAERIARVTASVGVSRLVHVSHLNASPTSTSHFYRSKAAGENAVRDVFPAATIVRPGPMFGHEDKFLTNMPSLSPFLFLIFSPWHQVLQSAWPIWWKLNHGETKARPVHVRFHTSRVILRPAHRIAQVMDVAQALSNLLGMPALSRTISLPGPSTLTHEYLLELVSTLTYNPPSRAPVLPKRVALMLARAAQSIWWPALSPDEVERRYIDDADTQGDWALVGVEPDEIENHAITYVRRYRSACVSPPTRAAYFSTPVLSNSQLAHFLTSANYIRPIVVPPRPVEHMSLIS
jgi:NADH dehydrogenase (ubiquinone) 1 alpha subcomplex subunit 9